MPASDLVITARFETNKYNIVYKVDGSVYKEESYDYGSEITLLSEPTKVGYTFSGWEPSVIPELMPSKDIEINGSFIINKYEVVFKDYDGSVLKSELVEHGSGASAPSTPNNKEGHHFVSWNKAYTNVKENIEVIAIYEINKYEVVFKDYDGSVLKSELVEHGSGASAPNDPSRIGYTFIGWDKDYSEIL